MPRYPYKILRIACLDPIEFKPNELRKAVTWLKRTPGAMDGKFIGLMAETDVRAGKFRLRAQPVLRLPEILGKTPREVWEMFDKIVDKDREDLAQRSRGGFKP